MSRFRVALVLSLLALTGAAWKQSNLAPPPEEVDPNRDYVTKEIAWKTIAPRVVCLKLGESPSYRLIARDKTFVTVMSDQWSRIQVGDRVTYLRWRWTREEP